MDSPTELALLGYIAWSIVLLGWLAGYRTTLVVGGQRRANSFSPAGDDVSAFSARLCRVHANCYESFPWFAGLLLLAIASGQTSITDPLALWLLGARIGQSATHLISTRERAVYLRFAFLLAQLAIAVIWVVGLGRALVG